MVGKLSFFELSLFFPCGFICLELSRLVDFSFEMRLLSSVFLLVVNKLLEWFVCACMVMC